MFESKTEKLVLGFLCSHSGSNMQAIINNILSGKIDAKVGAVISNNSTSGAMQKAKAQNIPAFHVSEKEYNSRVDETIIKIFKQHNVNLIILAGYMKKVSQELIKAFNGRVLNIHPALLPKYGGRGMYGIRVHQAVIEAGDKISGATVHLVDANYDQGRILLQRQVDVLHNDTAEVLASRVLEIEHIIYSEVINKISSGEIKI